MFWIKLVWLSYLSQRLEIYIPALLSLSQFHSSFELYVFTIHISLITPMKSWSIRKNFILKFCIFSTQTKNHGSSICLLLFFAILGVFSLSNSNSCSADKMHQLCLRITLRYVSSIWMYSLMTEYWNKLVQHANKHLYKN